MRRLSALSPLGRQRLRPGPLSRKRFALARRWNSTTSCSRSCSRSASCSGFSSWSRTSTCRTPAPATSHDGGAAERTGDARASPPPRPAPRPTSAPHRRRRPAAGRQRRESAGGGDRRAAAGQDRHAAPARLDRTDRRPDRRSDAGDLPRDGRSRRAPRSCCCGRAAPRTPISRNSAGPAQRRGRRPSSRARHAMDRRRAAR